MTFPASAGFFSSEAENLKAVTNANFLTGFLNGEK
jgi:hypothetical protein